MKTNIGKVARYSLLAITVLGIVLVVFGFYLMVRPLDSLGEADDNCARADFPSVANKSGMVATGHYIDCTYGIAHGEETTFVYLHKLGQKDGEKSLIFRFANGHNSYEPQVAWTDNSELRISVTEVGEVTKQVASVGGVKVLYSIGKEDAPAGESDRFRRRIAGVLFVALIFLTGICLLTVRSIQKVTKIIGHATS